MHALTSFVGCVGTLMAESGFQEIMESTFGGVSKMLNGKKIPKTCVFCVWLLRNC